MRFYKLHGSKNKGDILLDGVNIERIGTKVLRRYFGYVTQDTALFWTTLLANTTYGLGESEYTMHDVDTAVRRAAATGFISSFQRDKVLALEKMVGLCQIQTSLINQSFIGIKLYGGQKQRISLSRCSLRKSKVFLLDEPTASLDADSEVTILQPHHSCLTLF